MFKKLEILFFPVMFMLFWTNELTGDDLRLILKFKSNPQSKKEQTIFLGEELECELKIKGKRLKEIVNDKNNISGSNEFVYRIKVKPSKTGKYKVGPYKFKFQDQFLISDSLTINVLKGDEKYFKIFTSKNNVKKNEIIILSIKSKSKGINSITLRKNSKFLIGSSSLSSSFSVINGRSKFEITKYFRIKVIKSGKIIIDKTSFLNIPDGFKCNKIEINVKNRKNEIEYDPKFI